MSSHNPNLDQPTESTDSTEARMRLALGLGTRPANSGQTSATSSPPPASHDSGRQRRRFAQDGDVPVVMLHRGRDNDAGGENKLAALTADLREERSARAKLERALDEANVLVSSLQTKLKHAEMALEEKQLGESEARSQWEASIATEREARQQAETRAAEATLALSLLERKIEAAAKPPSNQPLPVEPLNSVDADLVFAPPSAPPTPNLFGELESSASNPAMPKRRMSRKTAALPESSPVAAAPAKVKAPEKTAEPAENNEDQPIEWWLPSFRAARKAPVRRKRAQS
jgi:hypothetical protein